MADIKLKSVAVPVTLLTISEWSLDPALSLLNKEERKDLMVIFTILQKSYMQSAEVVEYGSVEQSILFQGNCPIIIIWRTC